MIGEFGLMEVLDVELTEVGARRLNKLRVDWERIIPGRYAPAEGDSWQDGMTWSATTIDILVAFNDNVPRGVAAFRSIEKKEETK